MAIDEVIHVKRINDFFDFLKNDRGLIKKILMIFMRI